MCWTRLVLLFLLHIRLRDLTDGPSNSAPLISQRFPEKPTVALWRAARCILRTMADSSLNQVEAGGGPSMA